MPNDHLANRQGRATRAVLAGLFLVVAVFLGIWLLLPRTRTAAPIVAAEQVPRQTTAQGFVSSQQCAACHEDQHRSWRQTFHRTMTQVATPETVVAPFDDVQLASRGSSYTLSREDETYWITTIDPEWEQQLRAMGGGPQNDPPMVRRQIVMTTGSHHMQGYWFRSGEGNELLQLPFYYVFAEKRWIPREDVFLRPPNKDPQLANWNITCIKCHSVAGIPGGEPTKSEFNTTVAELGIACEACHGPAEEHVRLNRKQASDPSLPPIVDHRIANPARLSAKQQSQICGQCHSEFFPADPMSFWAKGIGYRAGQEFEKAIRVIRYKDEIYNEFKEKFQHTFWNDGTCRVGGDEYNGLVESPCYQKGELSCLSCHSMHQSEPNDMLAAKMESNHACQQCHTEPRFNDELSMHTNHSASSSGSACYNCHMPHTSFALMKSMRSHRVTSPKAGAIVTKSRPNACNLCHLDKTMAWTSSQLAEWYGRDRVELPNEEQNVAASLLWLLRGDAAQRAISAWHMSWPPARKASGDDWQARFLTELIDDPYMGVRYQAINSLKRLPHFQDFEADFIGSESDRFRAKGKAVSTWRSHVKPRGDEGRRVLLAPDGSLQRDAMDQLLLKRDDSFVKIPE